MFLTFRLPPPFAPGAGRATITLCSRDAEHVAHRDRRDDQNEGLPVFGPFPQPPVKAAPKLTSQV
jgi:hypothetical protein